MIVIGVSGRIGCGKDHVSAHMLLQYFTRLHQNVVIIAFADYLKLQCILNDNVAYEDVYHQKTDQSRVMLQQRGEQLRSQDKNIFIKAVDTQIHVFSERKIDVVIISDVRYKNEYEYIKFKFADQSFLLRVLAPLRNINKMKEECKGDEAKMKQIANHSSETELDYCDFDYSLANDYEDEKYVQHRLFAVLDKRFAQLRHSKQQLCNFC